MSIDAQLFSFQFQANFQNFFRLTDLFQPSRIMFGNRVLCTFIFTFFESSGLGRNDNGGFHHVTLTF